jgi:hypothetical protein
MTAVAPAASPPDAALPQRPAKPAKASPAAPPPSAVKRGDKAAPPVPRLKPAPRPADDGEPGARPARKRRAADGQDDTPPKKSGAGKVILVVVAVLLLVCGGAAGGTIWVVHRFFSAASNALAQMTDKANPVVDAGGEGGPDPADARPGEKPVNPPAGDGLDVRFAGPDFAAGVVIRGPRLLRSEVVKAVLPEEALGAMGGQFGIDPRKVERVVVLIEPTPGGNVLFFPGAIVRFTEAVEGKAVLGKALKDVQEASADGKAYLVSKTEKMAGTPMAGTPMAGHVADERTLLIAPEPTLKKMLAAKGDGPLAGQLRRIDPNSDLAAAFVVEPVKQLAGEALKEAKGSLPPEFGDVSALPERLKGGTLALDLKGDSLLKVTLEAVDDDAAAGLEKLLGRGKDMLKQAYPDLRKGLAPSLPPDLSKDVLDLLDKVPDGILVSRAGAAVTVALKSPGDLTPLAKKLAPLLLQGGPARPGDGGEWKTFTSPEYGFSASFPGEPKKSVRKFPDGTVVKFELALDGGAMQYAVVYHETEIKPGQAKAYFDGTAAQFEAKSIKSQRDIELKGVPGRELVIETEVQGTSVGLTTRLYVIKNHPFQVMVTALKSKQEAAQAKKFLDSFAPLDAPAPPPKPAPEEPKPLAALPPKPLAKPTATGDSLKGDAKQVMDVTVTRVKLSETTTLPCVAWADDKGSAFYALDASGTLRRVTFPDLKEEWRQDLKEKCAWLSPSSEGLLVTLADGKEVWLIDPAGGAMKSCFAIDGVKRAAGCAGRSRGRASPRGASTPASPSVPTRG